MTDQYFDHDLADLLSDTPPQHQVTAPAATPPRAATARRLAPFVWTGAGFIAGALFWHLVGFWSFVSDVAFNAPQSGSSASTSLARLKTPAKPSPSDIVTGSLPDKTMKAQKFEAHGCVAAARAETGGIVLVPCGQPPPSTKSVLAAPKQDMITPEPNLAEPSAISPAVPAPPNATEKSSEPGKAPALSAPNATPQDSPLQETLSHELWASDVDISISADPAAAPARSPAQGQRIIVEPPPSTR